MQTRHAPPAFRSGCRLLVCSALIATAATLPAQVPPGWAVVSSFFSRTNGPGGLDLVHPAVPGAPIPITGLSVEITGPAPGGFTAGAACVLVDPDTGNVIVGEHMAPGQTSDIHVLTLSGTAVTNTQSYTIGIAGGFAWVNQMDWLGDDIVFSVRGGAFTSGPFAGELVGILRPSLGPPGTPGTVVPVPITTNPPGAVNALTVDEANGVAYLAEFMCPTGCSGEAFAGTSGMSFVYSLPVPGNGTAVPLTSIATVNAIVQNLEWRNGRLLFAGFNANGPYLAAIDPSVNPATVTVLPTGSLSSMNGIDLETATGDLLVVDDVAKTLERLSGGINIPMATGLTGVPSGVAVNPSLQTYGMATAGANSYAWSIAPNAGGLPTVGNTNFSITIATSPGTAPGLLGLGLGPASMPLPGLGVTLLVDPATLVIRGFLPAQSVVTTSLPIPADPTFAGMDVFAQAGYIETGGIATTDGLKISVF